MKIIKNFILNSSYQILAIIIPLITTPYIARVLGPKGVGINTYTGAIVQLFIVLAVLGTGNYGNREIAYLQNNKEKRSQVFWGINFLSWITASISILLFLIFVYFSPDYQSIYLWQGLAILTSMFDISWYFRGIENFKIIVIRNCIFKILSVIAIFIFVHNENDLDIYIAIMMIGNLLGSLSMWPYLRKEVFRPNFHQLYIWKHFKNVLYLFIPTFSSSIYLVADKYMIGAMDSVNNAGFFNQSDIMIRLALSLVGSIGVVMLPHVANLHSKGDFIEIRRSICKTFNIASGLSIPIFFGILAISIKFAPFFFGPSFHMVGPIMMLESPIIVFLTWSNVFGMQYLLPMNRMKPYTLSITIGAFINIGINLILIPLFGVIGATISTVFSEFVVVAYQYYVIRDEFNFYELVKGIWKYIVASFAMFIVVFWMNKTLTMTALTLSLQILTGVLIYVGLNLVLRTKLWDTVKNVMTHILKRKVSSN